MESVIDAGVGGVPGLAGVPGVPNVAGLKVILTTAALPVVLAPVVVDVAPVGDTELAAPVSLVGMPRRPYNATRSSS